MIASTLPKPLLVMLHATSAASRKNWPLLALGSHTQP